MDRLQEHLNTLEDLLVKEFRASQNLLDLTRSERAALSANDVIQLVSIVERKEILLDELGRLDDSRRMSTQEAGSVLGIKKNPPSVADVLTYVDRTTAGRLGHLREGILTLMDQVRDLTYGNRALAASALQRCEAVQAFIISSYQTPSGYRPPSVALPGASEPARSLEIDSWA
jgi:flagellar biosynthesis/type III secretory pathway chaperone